MEDDSGTGMGLGMTLTLAEGNVVRTHCCQLTDNTTT